MNKERILSYCLSQELTEEELNLVSGAAPVAGTSVATANVTYGPQGGTDASADINYDF